MKLLKWAAFILVATLVIAGAVHAAAQPSPKPKPLTVTLNAEQAEALEAVIVSEAAAGRIVTLAALVQSRLDERLRHDVEWYEDRERKALSDQFRKLPPERKQDVLKILKGSGGGQ